MWPLRVLNHRAAIAPLALASVLLTAQTPLPEPAADTETELGLAVYNELEGVGEIIASSPLYDTLGPVVEPIAIDMIGDLHSHAYSRDIETAADVIGSDIYAAAGLNSWGLVWLFQDIQNADPKQIPELLSDHPANEPRVKTLEKHFRDSPSVFSRFNSGRASATPLSVAEDTPIHFLR
jgi:hypothetical protein